jgi:uncharacterized protein YoxC
MFKKIVNFFLAITIVIAHIAVVILLISGVYNIYTNWEEIASTLSEIQESISDTYSDAEKDFRKSAKKNLKSVERKL